jgi:hypothetical protein
MRLVREAREGCRARNLDELLRVVKADVLDLGRTVALSFALLFSIRTRSAVAVLLVLVVGYLYYLEIVTGFTARDAGPMHEAYAFVLVFLGPSGLPRTGNFLPLSHLVAAQPIVAQLCTAATLAIPRALLVRQSAPLRPESEDARRFDRASLQLTLVIVFDLFIAVCDGTVWLLSRARAAAIPPASHPPIAPMSSASVICGIWLASST